jgi:hypothetical protein
MQVTFTCEKCGHEYGEVDGLTMGTKTTREKIVDAMKCFERDGCPNCAQLTYGPITEEMMVDALVACSNSHSDAGDDFYTVEAQFVLRLLHALGDRSRIRAGGTEFNPLPWDYRRADPRTTWAEWLIALAPRP